jgi:hypothetical protein
MPLSLSDDELRIVMAAAQPIPPQDRDRFLRDVGEQLAKFREVGVGIVGRRGARCAAPSLRSARSAPDSTSLASTLIRKGGFFKNPPLVRVT